MGRTPPFPPFLADTPSIARRSAPRLTDCAWLQRNTSHDLGARKRDAKAAAVATHRRRISEDLVVLERQRFQQFMATNGLEQLFDAEHLAEHDPLCRLVARADRRLRRKAPGRALQPDASQLQRGCRERHRRDPAW